MDMDLIKKAVKEKTGKDCEIQTYYCNSEFYHFEGRTLTELKKNLEKEGLSFSRLKHIYRLVELLLPDESDVWCCHRFEGDTLEEACSKVYDFIEKLIGDKNEKHNQNQ